MSSDADDNDCANGPKSHADCHTTYGNRVIYYWYISIQWRHNERDSVSNHRRLDYLLNCLFRRSSKKPSKLRVTGLCEGSPPTAG